MNKRLPNGGERPQFHYSTKDRIDEKTGLHVWLLNLDDPVSSNALLGALSMSEWSRANTLKDNLQRDRFLARHFYVREVLYSLTGLPAACFEFTKDSCGKPRVKGFSQYPSDSAKRLSFSVSHTEDLLAVAVTFDQEVGVDLEKINHEFDPGSLAAANFPKEDIARLQLLPSEHRALAFYRLWTRREAVGKMMGNGILPRTTGETNSSSLAHLSMFEYSHKNERVLGAVALGDHPLGSHSEQS